MYQPQQRWHCDALSGLGHMFLVNQQAWYVTGTALTSRGNIMIDPIYHAYQGRTLCYLLKVLRLLTTVRASSTTVRNVPFTQVFPRKRRAAVCASRVSGGGVCGLCCTTGRLAGLMVYLGNSRPHHLVNDDILHTSFACALVALPFNLRWCLL